MMDQLADDLSRLIDSDTAEDEKYLEKLINIDYIANSDNNNVASQHTLHIKQEISTDIAQNQIEKYFQTEPKLGNNPRPRTETEIHTGIKEERNDYDMVPTLKVEVEVENSGNTVIKSEPDDGFYQAESNLHPFTMKIEQEFIKHEEREFKLESPDYDCDTNDSTKSKSDSEKVRSRNGKLCSPKGEWTCELCGILMYSKPGLVWHIKVKHNKNKKLYECFHCGQKMISKCWLARHINVKHNQNFKMFKCPQCDYENKWKTNIFRHIQVKHVENPRKFNCEYCSYSSMWQGTLRRHKLDKHPNECKRNPKKSGSKKKEEKNTEFPCNICGHKSKSKSGLRVHIRYRHDLTETFTCTGCPFTTKYKRHLKYHFNAKHSNNPEMYRCRKCDFETSVRNDLLKHVRNTHNLHSKKTYKCEQCEVTLDKKKELKKHILLIHERKTGKTGFVHCAQCAYQVKNKSTLINHIKSKHANNIVSTDSEYIKCPHCKKKLKKNSLNRHVSALHPGVKMKTGKYSRSK